MFVYARTRPHGIIIYIEISKANITHANYTPFIRSDYVFAHWISLTQWILREWGPIIMTCFPLQRIWLLNFAGTRERARESVCGVYLTHSIQKPETIHVHRERDRENSWLVPCEHANQMIMNRIENIIVATAASTTHTHLRGKFFNFTNSTNCNNQKYNSRTHEIFVSSFFTRDSRLFPYLECEVYVTNNAKCTSFIRSTWSTVLLLHARASLSSVKSFEFSGECTALNIHVQRIETNYYAHFFVSIVIIIVGCLMRRAVNVLWKGPSSSKRRITDTRLFRNGFYVRLSAVKSVPASIVFVANVKSFRIFCFWFGENENVITLTVAKWLW